MNSANEQKPRLLVIAGPNGAGKTTVTERGLAHEWFAGCQYINPDFIARDEFGDWNSPDAILKAAQLASQRREDYLANSQSMAFETVFSAPDKVEFLYRAHQQGYFIRVFFVATADPSINASRVARRVMQGGHDVPIPKIINRYFRSITQCVVYDNSIDDAEASLILRATEGKITKLYQPAPEWMGPNLGANNTIIQCPTPTTS